MRKSVLVALILAAAIAVPAAAQDRLEDRIVANALLGPGFVAEDAVFNMRASAGIRATDWLTVAGEWGSLSRGDSQNMFGGTHLNANVFASPSEPVYYNLRPYATIGAGSFRVSEGLAGVADRAEFATNVGGGVAYDFNRWFGVGLDYRRFFVDLGNDMRGKDRWTFGVNVGLR